MKLVVSDYDNTFYIEEQTIIDNIKAIQNFIKENKFAIATGRSYINFKNVDDIYHIPYHYLIINHGATILKNDFIIYNKTIDDEIKNKLLIDLQLERAFHAYGCFEKINIMNLTKRNFSKICVEYKDAVLARSIYEIVTSNFQNKLNVYLVDSNETIEITSANIDKAEAIKEIAQLENINLNNIYTIGDNHNDIKMIQTYQGYAIKGAIEEVKQKAIKEYSSVADLIDDII